MLSVLLAIFSIEMIAGTPIVSPLSDVPSPGLNDPIQRAEAEDFVRFNGVTKQEIDEYNRLSKYCKYHLFYRLHNTIKPCVI